MANTMECRTCGFDLRALPARIRIEAKDEGRRVVSCPMCGNGIEVRAQAHGILVRGSGGATTYARWKLSGKDDAASLLRLQRVVVEFPSMGTIEPREVCYPRVPAFLTEDRKLRVPDLPVRAELFDCVDEVALERMLRAGPIGEIVGSQYQVAVPLLGLADPFRLSIPIATPQVGPPAADNAFAEINLRVWPNIDVREWKYYLAGFAATGPAAEALITSDRLRGLARTGDEVEWRPLQDAQNAGSSRLVQMNGRPRWIALELMEARKGGDASIAAGGVFVVPRASRGSEPMHAEYEARFGLDFGTSNTCVAVGQFMTTSNAEPQILPEVSETDWNLYLVRGGEETRSPKGPDLWPSPYGFGKSGDLLPTELLFLRAKRDMGPGLGRIDSWRYGVDYGIPGAGVAPEFAESEHALGDFKWRGLLQRTGPMFVPQLEKLQEHYLTAALIWSYVRAAVASGQAAKNVGVSYSYPMAFNDMDLKALMASADATGERLTGITGIEWRLLPSVDESTAAAKNAGETEANVLVYLDMGGGSTDIVVKLQATGTKWETVYSTSVAYAGTVLLHGFAGRDPRSSCLAGKTTVDVLRRKVRQARDAREVLGDTTLFNRAFERVVENRTKHFYGYLIEMLARMLAAGILDQRFREPRDGKLSFPAELKLGFFFLGNGWGFASASADDVASVLTDQIYQRALGLMRADKSAHAIEVKKGLKETRFKPVIGRLQKVPHAKAAVALGVLKAVGASGAAKGEPRSGILGWTTKADNREIPWFARYSRAGSMGPVAPNGIAVSDRVDFDTISDDEPPSETNSASATPWYERISPAARLDWQDVAPAVPETLEQPFFLDEGLNNTRGQLRSRCKVNDGGFFSEGPYEVMLEELFGPKIGEIA